MTIVIDEEIISDYHKMQRSVMSLIFKAKEKLNNGEYNFTTELIGQAVEELNKYEERCVDPKYKNKRQSPTYGLRKSISKMEIKLVGRE